MAESFIGVVQSLLSMATDEQRKKRLIEHIIWADKYGVIEKVADYVLGLGNTKSC